MSWTGRKLPHSRDANPPVKTWHFLRGSQVKPSLEMSNRNPLNIGIAYNILKVQNLLRILHLLVFEAIFQKMSQLDVICWTIYFLKIHPRNLTWNLKISQFVEKESPFKETIIFRFQPLNFGGVLFFNGFFQFELQTPRIKPLPFLTAVRVKFPGIPNRFFGGNFIYPNTCCFHGFSVIWWIVSRFFVS